MLMGTMQQSPLLIADILNHASKAHGEREIVSRLVEEPIWKYNYRGLAERAAKAASGFITLGVTQGTAVTTLAWNTHRHYELFFAVPGIGAILHTANPRLSDDQIIYTINHAESTVLVFDRSFDALVLRISASLKHIKYFISLSDEPNSSLPGLHVNSYESLLRDAQGIEAWPRFDENAGAILCYTSGTTGDPKGVLYSHRSIVLHAMAAGLSGAFGFTAFDCIMPCSSLYHGTAWGVPFAAAINGCKFVLPCDRMDARSLQELIQNEGVTFSGGVPTIWTDYLNYLSMTGENTGNLNCLVIGGSAVPRAMAEIFQTRYGVSVRQLWGMTETSPLGVVATPTPQLASLGSVATNDAIWTKQGRLQFGIELRVVSEDGDPVARNITGALQVRGPWTIEKYYKADVAVIDENGWFDTGDIGCIDEFGFLRLTDRAKDVIKSGGEWVSSIDIENIAIGIPGVKVAAVVGAYHPRWEERPILIIEAHHGAAVEESEVVKHLSSRIVKWWMPDAIIFDEVPLTATGKIDKKNLRQRYANCLVARAATSLPPVPEKEV